nr:MAG TPA: hypothetical protein [Caudoviricetes sp.]
MTISTSSHLLSMILLYHVLTCLSSIFSNFYKNIF